MEAIELFRTTSKNVAAVCRNMEKVFRTVAFTFVVHWTSIKVINWKRYRRSNPSTTNTTPTRLLMTATWRDASHQKFCKRNYRQTKTTHQTAILNSSGFQVGPSDSSISLVLEHYHYYDTNLHCSKCAHTHTNAYADTRVSDLG